MTAAGRLAMASLRIDIDGPSWRQRAAKERAAKERAAAHPSGDSDDDDDASPKDPRHE